MSQAKDTEIHIEMRPLASLIVDPNNAKMHPEVQVDQIVQSITAFGFCDPIGIDPEGNVIEGHGRVLAAQRLGLEEVPVLVVEGLTERERTAYAIAHNQTGQNVTLDDNIVRDELSDLGVMPDEYMAVGFTSDDIMFLNMMAAEANEEQERTDHNGAPHENPKVLLPTVHSTDIKFDTHEQSDQWLSFIIQCRLRYPDKETIAERMMAFVDEFSDLLGGAS